MKTRIINKRLAGDNHQVLTIKGGSGLQYRHEPCDDCPWRTDNEGLFPSEAFLHSAGTAYDMAQHTFACHMSGSEKPADCAGFLLRGAAHNLTVRMKLSDGRIDPSTIHDGGHELFGSYREMAEANGCDPDDPILKPCRDST